MTEERRVQIILDSGNASRDAQNLDRDMRNLGGSADRTQLRMNALSKAIAGVTSAIALAAVIGKTVSAFADFDTAMSDLQAITGATGDDLNFLSDAAREFGATTTLSATQSAEAIKLIASAKPDLLANAEALKQVTKEAIALAEATGEDLPASASTLGASLNQFNLAATESSRVINVLAAGAKFGSSEVATTAEALKEAGVSANSANISFEETNASIQVLAANAIKGSQAGTGLRNIFTILDTQLDKSLNPSVVGLSQALKSLDAQQLSSVELVKLFGRENINAGRILLNNVDKLDQLTESLTGTNTAYDQQKIRIDNLNGDIKALSSAYEGLKISIGENFNESARNSVQLFTVLMQNLNQDVLSLGASINSGQLPAAFNAWRSSFGGFANYYTEKADEMGLSIVNLGSYAELFSDRMGDLLSSAFINAGPNIEAFIKLITVELLSAFDKAVSYAKFLKTSLSDFSFDKATKELEKNLNRINQVRLDSIEITLQDNDIAKKVLQEKIEGSNALRAAYEEELKLKKAQREEERKALELRTASTITAPDSNSAPVSAGAPTASADTASFAADLASQTAALQRELNLRTNITAIHNQAKLEQQQTLFAEEYIAQQINEQTLLAEAEAKALEAEARRIEQFNARLAQLAVDDATEKSLRAEFDQAQLIADQILQENRTAIEKQGAQDRQKLAQAEANAKIDLWSSTANDGLSVLKTFAGNSFKAQKALAIGEGAINIAGGIAKALNNPFPLNLGFAAKVGLAGKKVMSAINGSKVGSGSTPSISGSSSVPTTQSVSSVPAATPKAPTPNIINMVIDEDALISGDRLVAMMKKAKENGADLNFVTQDT